jgi:8-oxo-dGTP diphosphatase
MPAMATAPGRRRPAIRARLVIRRGDAVLLARHRHPDREFWCFPGGGVEPGETAAAAALREAEEETGLRVALLGLCYVQDRPEAESIDLFFAAEVTGGDMRLGADPERAEQAPVLAELRWVRRAELARLPVLPAGLAAALADGRCAGWGTLPVPGAG